VLCGQALASSQPPVGEPSDKLVDVVDSARGAWVGIGMDALLASPQGDMADLFLIEGLPLCRDPKVLRARDDFRRSLFDRLAGWRYHRIHDDDP
jgi:hypothetical protein